MKGKIVNVLLGVCACAFVLSAGTAAAVYAGAEGAASPVLTMKKGASVRLFEPTGIRFVTEISAEDYAEITAGGNAEFGTLIIPTEVLGNTQITAENYKDLDAELIVTETWLANTETTKSYAGALAGTETSDGNYENFPEKFYDCELTAVSYCAYAEKVIFAENPQRYSMAYAASASIAEGQTDPFLTKITDSVLSEGLSFGADSYTLTVGETAETTLVSGGAEVTLKAVYESNNEEAVAVDENGTLTAKAAGSATITATIGNKTANVQVTAEISAVSMTASGSFEVEAKGEAETFALDLNADAGKIKGELSSVTLGDKKFSEAEYADGVLTLDRATIADAWGEQIVSAVFLVRENDVVTEALTVEIDVLFITRIIENQADLDAMAADGAAALNESVFWDGYYVLGADVECDYGEGFYPSVSWPKSFDDNAINVYTANAGFRGVFDGRGYNVDGLRTTSKRAFFLTMAKGGIVKNISFTNAVHTGGSGDAFLATYGNGVFENIYVELNSLSAGSGVFNGAEALSDARVRNCFAVCKTPSENTFLGYKNGTPPGAEPVRHFDKVYSVGLAGDPVMPNWQKTSGYADDNATKNYADRAAMTAAVKAGEINFDDWDRDFWTFDADGLPVPAHMPE